MAAAVYVVRHAHAVPRDAWGGSERDRPLTERGAREATALVDRFDTTSVDSASHKRGGKTHKPRPTILMASRAERCLSTLQPLATACGLPIVIAEWLSEGTDVDSFFVQLKELAAGGGLPVICTHGDVIWSLVDLLVAAGTPIAGPVEIRKGSILVLEMAGGDVESARYVPPAKV